MENSDFEIRTSGIHGKGLYAKRDFRKGEKIYTYPQGKIIGDAEIEKLSSEEQLHLDKIAEGKYEVILSPACFVNHSCDANVSEKEHAGYALKDIKKGDELTTDYDKIAWLDEPLKCHCGAKNCRGVIRGRK